MSKNKVELASGRKVELREMSIDEVDFCSDIADILYNDSGEISAVKGVSKARTAWLRRGIAGGDFKSFSTDLKGLVEDAALKELNEAEKNELMKLIQEYQKMGE
tara:strand:- start:627 stop:938 length:312 start_codon:yes stop_codon:yes gene_type:complete